MKLTTALIKDYIGNNILGKKLNLSNKHEVDLEEDPDGSVFKRDEVKFNNAKNWKRIYKAKVSECNSDRLSWSKYYTFTLPQSKQEKDSEMFALKRSFLNSDCLDILISTDKFNDLFSTYDIGNCIVRVFELNYDDFEMYQEDYTLLVYSDAKDENVIMWCADSD